MGFDFYLKEYRAVEKTGGVRLYHEKSSVFVDQSISFDKEKREFTSIDLFVASIVTDIMLTMRSVADRRDILIQDLETKGRVVIRNPMGTRFVIGYDPRSSIETIELEIYYFSFLTPKKEESFLEETLQRALLYQTLKEKLNVNFKKIL